MPTWKIKAGTKTFSQWLLHLFGQPVFIFVTLWGHLAILTGAFVFYYFERAVNVKVGSWLDAYYWAISVATTVGSDIAPTTPGGKLAAIGMMVTGALFLWSYTALFAASLVATDMRRVEAEVEELETGLAHEMRIDHDSLKRLTAEVKKLQKLLENLDENRRV